LQGSHGIRFFSHVEEVHLAMSIVVDFLSALVTAYVGGAECNRDHCVGIQALLQIEGKIANKCVEFSVSITWHPQRSTKKEEVAQFLIVSNLRSYTHFRDYVAK
jgi:hypothetical protein